MMTPLLAPPWPVQGSASSSDGGRLQAVTGSASSSDGVGFGPPPQHQPMMPMHQPMPRQHQPMTPPGVLQAMPAMPSPMQPLTPPGVLQARPAMPPVMPSQIPPGVLQAVPLTPRGLSPCAQDFRQRGRKPGSRRSLSCHPWCHRLPFCHRPIIQVQDVHGYRHIR
jgi:hypothetical protein